MPSTAGSKRCKRAAAPRVSGYIERVNYTEGDEVKKGQVLFTIDDRTYRAAREQAQAELVRARNQAALARSESSRTEKRSALRPSLRKFGSSAGRPPRRRKATCWQRRPSSIWRS